jgi:uncharacterized lipoprotein YddW (UPF0748 family)
VPPTEPDPHPRMLRRLLLLACLLLPVAAEAQPEPAPLYETRGTWLTTVWRLDWPPVGSAATQEASLRHIIRNIKRLGMNTVVFQVVSHGEAMYPSERLPWANWLTGTPGRDPGFDPLAVAIDEAHRIGLEVHAWMNVFHVAAATSNISPTAEPVHVRFAHPEWVVQHSDGSYWGNPGIPELRDWVVGNVMELVRNYDLDAIHFDYMRYPAREGLTGDNALMAQYPNGATNLAQWRRENVNLFVRQTYEAVKAEKPWVKVGSAPIGAYRWYSGAPPAYWAWDDVYQEGHRWLSDGVMDYVAPQLYFTIANDPLPPNTFQSPDFVHWLRDWMANSNGRHVYAGQGTWLETAERRFPSGEIASQIAVTRQEGAEGQVHFRYSHTTGSPFGGQYQRPSLPPPMPWLENAAAPSVPGELTIHHEPESLEIRLTWHHSEGAGADPLRRYAIFRREGGTPSTSAPYDLYAVVGAGDTAFVEAFTSLPQAPVEYVVVAQSLLGFVSEESNAVSTLGTGLSTDSPVVGAGLRLRAPYPNPSTGTAAFAFELVGSDDVTLTVYDVLGRIVAMPAEGYFAPGEHRVAFDGTALPAGVYVVELSTSAGRHVQRLTIVR